MTAPAEVLLMYPTTIDAIETLDRECSVAVFCKPLLRTLKLLNVESIDGWNVGAGRSRPPHGRALDLGLDLPSLLGL